MTNYERIKEMSIDEMTNLLEVSCKFCIYNGGNCLMDCKYGAKQWLEEEVQK